MNGMKPKTIKAIITKKVNKWLESIEDTTLREAVRKNTIVTGGCIASMLLGEPVNDFDLYLRNNHVAVALANYYVRKLDNGSDMTVENVDGRVKVRIESSGVAMPDDIAEIEEAADTHEDTEIASLQAEDSGKFRPVFITANAITLSDKVQIILRFCGEPEEIHANYDFSHCTSYWKSWDGVLILPPEALVSLLTKELRYVGSKYPVCSVVRLRKFINRGWRINAGQIVKMAMQISQLDLMDIDVLEDQLTGVDTSYFLQLIRDLRLNSDKMNPDYIGTIIDRLF